MSRLTDFYNEDGYDFENRSLRQLLSYSNDELETSHDVIQWLFPLADKSNFNEDAPILTEEDISFFHRSPPLRENYRAAFWRFVEFLGLGPGEEGLVFAEDFDERAQTVWNYFNHNMLRITRVLKSAKLLEFDEEADGLYAKCKEIYESGKFKIMAETFKHWTDAVKTEEAVT